MKEELVHVGYHSFAEKFILYYFSLFLRDCCNCIVEKLELY